MNWHISFAVMACGTGCAAGRTPRHLGSTAALWVLSRRLEATSEEVCDDYVVNSGAKRSDYAGQLLELAGRSLPPMAPASVGMVSLRSLLARRVIRILDTSRAISTRAGTRAVVVMVAVGLALTLLAGLLGINERQTAEASTADIVSDTGPDPTGKKVRGQVFGPDGAPMAGATVIAWRMRLDGPRIDDEHVTRKATVIARQTTGNDGRYEFDFETAEVAAAARIIAIARGSGLGYPGKGELIRLTAGDLPIAGRLVDLEGRPVAGAKVALGQVMLPAGDARQIAMPKQSGAPVTKMRMTSPGLPAADDPFSMRGRMFLDATGLLSDGLVTDSDGRFRIEGLGRDVIANLTISGPTIAYKQVRVITRAMGRVGDVSRDPSVRGLGEAATYGATCTITVEPTRPIEGFVRDAETKQPIPGAIVTAAGLSGSLLNIEGVIVTETDAQGHYRLLGLPKEGAAGHKLAVHPPLDRPYFSSGWLEAPAKPGFEPLSFDISLKSGIWIGGKVTEVATGKPVAAAVDYFPMIANKHAQDYPNFDPNITASVGIDTRRKTAADGSFQVVGLPGVGVVTVHTDDRSYLGGYGAESIKGRSGQDQLLTYNHIFPTMYQSLKQITVPEGATSFVCDMSVDGGRTVRLRLVDESGEPVTNATVWGRNPEGSDYGDRNLYNESVTRVAGLEPSKVRTIVIQHRSRKIGAVFTVTSDQAGKDAEQTVTLRPCATLTGRLLGSDGKPAKGGVRIEMVREAAALFKQISLTSAEADSEGRFRCDDLPAGGPYQVTVAERLVYGFGRRMDPDSYKPFVLSKELKVEPGQTIDLGPIDVNAGKQAGNDPAPKATAADVPITGRVLNLEGQPVAGVAVKVEHVYVPKHDNLLPWLEGVKKGEPPWVSSGHIEWERKGAAAAAPRETTTDQSGRFRLDGLGADRIVGIELQGPTIAFATIEVVTRKTEAFPAAGYANTFGSGKQTIYGCDFTYTATPSRLIEGSVKDSQTGRALAGAEIRSYHFAGSDFIGIMRLKTKTDERGRFQLAGLPKGAGNKIIIVPSDEQPYFMQEVKIPDPPGAGPVSLELALQRAIWIEGKLTEKATGKPVEGAWLHYFPFLANTFAQQHAAFDGDRNTDGVGFQHRYLTKADGSFRLVGLPGRAIVGAVVDKGEYIQGAGSEAIEGMSAAGHFETFNNPIIPGRLFPTVMKEINPPADAGSVHVDLEVVNGPSVRVRVVDPEGKPIADLETRGRFGRSSFDKVDMTAADAEVANLMRDEQRIFVVRHHERRLGKVATVKQGDDASGPVVIRLAHLATIRGRVVDAEGSPVGAAIIRPDVLPHGDFGLSLANVVTGADGRFAIEDIPTGCDYGIAVETKEPIKGRRYAHHPRAAVTPGETTEIGDIKIE